MPATHVALLRGINVGTAKRVAMADLRGVVAGLGYTGVRTLLNSGNVVFRAQKATPKALEDALGGVRVILRTEGGLRKVAENNPFDPIRNPSYLHVAFCDKKVSADTLRDAYGDKGPEVIRGGGGRELYIDYVNGVGRSKLSHAYIERTLGATATLRNWNTVTKLLAMASR